MATVAGIYQRVLSRRHPERIRVRGSVVAAGRFIEEFYNEYHDKANGRFSKGGAGGGGVRSARAEITSALKGSRATEFISKIGPRKPNEDLFAYQSRALSGLPPEVKNTILAKIRERPEPVEFVRAAMDKFLSDHGLPPGKIDYQNGKADLAEAGRVVAAIKATPRDDNNPMFRAAYDDFKRQTEVMWKYLTDSPENGGMGVHVEEWDERTRGTDNPYSTSAAQSADVANNHHLFMNRGEFFIGHNESSPTGTDHPFMTGDEYFRFRAVHDTFGHVAHGTGFDRHGEYLAWLTHNTMYTGQGRKAMSTEYHGVNVHLWYTGTPMPKNRFGIILPDSVIDE